MDATAQSIQHVIIRLLLQIWPNRVWADKLPLRDGPVTSTDYAAVVSLVSDVTQREGCDGDSRRALVQVTVYFRRCDSCERFPAGIESATANAITNYLKMASENHSNGSLTVNQLNRRSSVSMNDDSGPEKIKAMATTYAVDYVLC